MHRPVVGGKYPLEKKIGHGSFGMKVPFIVDGVHSAYAYGQYLPRSDMPLGGNVSNALEYIEGDVDTLLISEFIVSIITVEGGNPTSQLTAFPSAWADTDNQGSWFYVCGLYVRYLATFLTRRADPLPPHLICSNDLITFLRLVL
jgi:hypothetical protein